MHSRCPRQGLHLTFSLSYFTFWDWQSQIKKFHDICEILAVSCRPRSNVTEFVLAWWYTIIQGSSRATCSESPQAWLNTAYNLEYPAKFACPSASMRSKINSPTNMLYKTWDAPHKPAFFEVYLKCRIVFPSMADGLIYMCFVNLNDETSDPV